MAMTTTNYGLTKPETTDNYDIEVHNANMDMIDAELKKGEDHRNNTDNPHKVTAEQVGAINPNLLINGDFRVNQRGHESYSTAGYTFDRWMNSFDASSMTSTVYRTTIGSTPGSNVYRVHIRIDSAAHAVENNFMQRLEDTPSGVSPVQGKMVTFSVGVRAVSENYNDYRCVYIAYHEAGKSDYTIKATPIFKETNGRVSITADIPIGASKVECGVGYTRLITPDDAGSEIDIWDAKLEIGSVATPFSPRPYAEELALCQRYYQIRSSSSVSTVDLRPTMRTTPTKNSVSGGDAYYDAEIY
ncbi:MAG TPA: hypothetical protein GXX74_07415 [Clostridiales bacterium]|nr:hypothetical protein [Clostridiales bacterium]